MALASVDKNGQPHNIAVACCKVEDDKIIVSNTHIYQTIENIKSNSRVSLVVWNKEWETACAGFELIGKATSHESGIWFDYVQKLPDNDGYDIKSAIVIEIEKIKRLEC